MIKNIFVLLFLATTTLSFSQDELSSVQTIEVDRYKNSQSNLLFIHTGFNNAPIIDQAQLEMLKDQNIFHVDLVYTAYKESESFNQKKLNENRVIALNEYLPQLKDDLPSWSVFEQTGALTSEEAEKYFHGFVIHYGTTIDYQNQKDFFGEIQTPFSTVEIDNREGGRAVYYSGSSIEMEKYAVTYPDGSAVEGFYTLKYREFRNQSEIALSGIPMVFSSENEELFNSAGMYEIRAHKDGQELILQKNAIVNFQTTEILDDVAFYDMDESGHWNENQAIEFTDEGNPVGMQKSLSLWDKKGPKRITLKKFDNRDDIDQGGFQGYSRIIRSASADYNQFVVEIDQACYYRYLQLKEKGDSLFLNTKDQGLMLSLHIIMVPGGNAINFVEEMMALPIESLEVKKEKKVTVYMTPGYSKNQKLVNVLGDEPIPPSPGLVRGLMSSNFGVFNCDQTFRIDAPIALTPTYYDRKTGKQLQNLYVACVIDMDLNVSLSYHPNHLVVNRRGNNQLVLFNEKREIFLLDQAAFHALDLNQMEINLSLVNITGDIRTPEDLQAILNI